MCFKISMPSTGSQSVRNAKTIRNWINKYHMPQFWFMTGLFMTYMFLCQAIVM